MRQDVEIAKYDTYTYFYFITFFFIIIVLTE